MNDIVEIMHQETGEIQQIDPLEQFKERWSKIEIGLIMRNCTIGATQSELMTFLYLCAQYDLDPLKKEMYFIKGKDGSKPIMMTSRDGYLKIALRSTEFDGIEADTVYIDDKLTKRPDASFCIEYGEGHMKFDRTKLMGAFCNVFRKDMSKATSVFVSMKDYDKGANMWNKYPNAMIIKIAESQALKRAFALSGLVTEEEIGDGK